MDTTQTTPTAAAASNAIDNLDMVIRSYRLGEWSEPYREDLKHDIQVKLDHDDIEWIKVEVLAEDRTVIYRHEERFEFADGDARKFDSAHGLELPVIDRDLATDYRMVTSGPRAAQRYEHLLRFNWRRAEKLLERPGSGFRGEHSAANSNGRTRSEVFVADESRRQGTLIRMGDSYGFIRDRRYGNVFVHVNFCGDDTELVPGRSYSYLAIQTPRGLQARDVREVA